MKHQHRRERHTRNEISLEQPLGFLQEPMHPFQPGLLHEPGCSPHVAADKAEADSDAQPPGVRQLTSDSLDQQFLLWRAQRHVDDIRL